MLNQLIPPSSSTKNQLIHPSSLNVYQPTNLTINQPSMSIINKLQALQPVTSNLSQPKTTILIHHILLSYTQAKY